MLIGRDAALFGFLALHHLRQALVVIIDNRVVAAFFVDLEEPVKEHDLASGAQTHLSVCAADLNRGTLKPGRFHLAGQRAFPDQIIKLALVRFADFQADRVFGHVGRANTFMRFLRIFGFVFVDARLAGHVLRAVAIFDRITGLLDRFWRHVDAIGPHICNVTCLIEPLRRVHGLACTHAELSARLLLER